MEYSPRSIETEGALFHVVEVEAGEDSCSKSIAPVGEKVYDDVSSWDLRGRRKIKEQVCPA
jgi:hypothetical protein